MALSACLVGTTFAADATRDIQLKVRPRVCTLSVDDEACETTVRAEWRAKKDESLCLVVVDRPDVRQCWEKFSAGVYSIEIEFSEDLTVQLRDPELETVLASQAVKVIREAIRLRRKRHQPWNIFS